MAKPSCVTRPICFAAMDGVSKPEKKVPNFTGDAAESRKPRRMREPRSALAEPADAEDPLEAEEGGSSEEVESSAEVESPDVESPSPDSAWWIMAGRGWGRGGSFWARYCGQNPANRLRNRMWMVMMMMMIHHP